MKWENLGINDVQRRNISKFRKLDKLFYDDALIDIIFGYTKLYSYRKKADISFDITNEKFTYS